MLGHLQRHSLSADIKDPTEGLLALGNTVERVANGTSVTTDKVAPTIIKVRLPNLSKMKIEIPVPTAAIVVTEMEQGCISVPLRQSIDERLTNNADLERITDSKLLDEQNQVASEEPRTRGRSVTCQAQGDELDVKQGQLTTKSSGNSLASHSSPQVSASEQLKPVTLRSVILFGMITVEDDLLKFRFDSPWVASGS